MDPLMSSLFIDIEFPAPAFGKFNKSWRHGNPRFCERGVEEPSEIATADGWDLFLFPHRFYYPIIDLV
jgi:hypothetical protein